jgi:DNA polymerase-3 subunit beta
MELTIDHAVLHRALRLIGHLVPAKLRLPILQHVLLDTTPGALTLAATDLKVGVSTTVAARVVTPGRTAVPARLLVEYVGQPPADTVRLVRDPATPRLEVSSGRCRAGFATADPDRFPVPPTAAGGTTLDRRPAERRSTSTRGW